MEKFKELGLNDELLKGIADLGFETPSPVQEKVIPTILQESGDIVALAQTGTGKTAAFGLPVLQRLNRKSADTQVLILSPTRELCMQIGNDLKNYAKYCPDINVVCVYGGADIRRQMREIEKGVHILVATPGRLCDLIKRKAVNINSIFAVILDEADEMLNMGFKEDLNFILDETPDMRATYLFSATMPREVERIARNYLKSPIEISVGKKNQGADTVKHIYYQVRAKDCYETLHRVIDCEPEMYAIIFVRTKMDAREIAHKLQKDNIDCDALHGDLSQAQRDEVMSQFRSKRLKVLVATDVAARGLDVDNLTHVINYNLPEDVESYTHRSGRTGRAGREGVSVAIIHSKETGKLRRIESILKKKFEYNPVPNGDDICRAQLHYYAGKILNAEHNEALAPFEAEIVTCFAELSREELISKLISYEFGRILGKYKNVIDLNLSEDERGSRRSDRGDRDERSDRGGRRGERGERSDRRDRDDEGNVFTSFLINVGKNDGVSPRDLIDVINKYAPRRGLEIGSIRIQDESSKFEIDVRKVKNFADSFRNAMYNGMPLSISEVSGGSAGRNDRGGNGGGRRNDHRRFDDRSHSRDRDRERGGSDRSRRDRYGKKRKLM